MMKAPSYNKAPRVCAHVSELAIAASSNSEMATPGGGKYLRVVPLLLPACLLLTDGMPALEWRYASRAAAAVAFAAAALPCVVLRLMLLHLKALQG